MSQHYSCLAIENSLMDFAITFEQMKSILMEMNPGQGEIDPYNFFNVSSGTAGFIENIDDIIAKMMELGIEPSQGGVSGNKVYAISLFLELYGLNPEVIYSAPIGHDNLSRMFLGLDVDGAPDSIHSTKFGRHVLPAVVLQDEEIMTLISMDEYLPDGTLGPRTFLWRPEESSATAYNENDLDTIIPGRETTVRNSVSKSRFLLLNAYDCLNKIDAYVEASKLAEVNGDDTLTVMDASFYDTRLDGLMDDYFDKGGTADIVTISGNHDYETVIKEKFLDRGVRVVVNTLGDQGSQIYVKKNSEVYDIEVGIIDPFYDVEGMVSKNGAGDMYLAGFLAKWMQLESEGKSVISSLGDIALCGQDGSFWGAQNIAYQTARVPEQDLRKIHKEAYEAGTSRRIKSKNLGKI